MSRETRRSSWSYALVVSCAVVGGTLALAMNPAQDKGGAQGMGPDLFGALVSGLNATPGCLGVDAGQMSSGKRAIFAWFENKQAARRWYDSEVHRGAMRMMFPQGTPSRPAAEGEVGGPAGGADREPMEGVPDGVPLMVIASITPPNAQTPPGMPVSQIAIELYTPVTGGLYLGSRFAPEGLAVPDMRDYTPPALNKH